VTPGWTYAGSNVTRGSTMRLLAANLLFTIIFFPAPVTAECGCFCVDGAPLTLCMKVDDAQARVDRCGSRASEVCPVPLDAPARRAYPAPVEGALNCRDVQVYDSGTGSHTSRKVCDVEPAAGAGPMRVPNSGGEGDLA
jgi:hypothetical protein